MLIIYIDFETGFDKVLDSGVKVTLIDMETT